MLIIGIDPGASGAIAFLNDGVLIDVADMPTDTVKVGAKLRKRINPQRLACIFQGQWSRQVAFLENVGPNPHDGAASAFSFGRAFGYAEQALASECIPYTLVTPMEWKRAMRCPADKDAARKRACQLFPESSALFARVKDDGRAEAALIALYGYGLQQGGRT
jgi:crossover junction endodeoxyribonuclease RuvC